jgi:hypothetical protein
LEHALAPRHLAWLAHENSIGANIYVGANPLRSDSRKRTKECIAAVRHLYLDLDTDGEARLASLRASHAVPTPTAVLSTSLGKYQILWRVDGFTFDQQESTLKLLVIGFGGDPACTDCNRVLRLPGFLNCKYDPPYPVTVQYPSDSTWNPGDFRLDTSAANPMLLSNAMAPRQHPDKHSNSERDWAWVLHELALGKDPKKLTRSLASRRADKPRPLYYAPADGRCCIGQTLAYPRYPDGRHCHDACSPAALRDSGRTLLRSRARDCANRTVDDYRENY